MDAEGDALPMGDNPRNPDAAHASEQPKDGILVEHEVVAGGDDGDNGDDPTGKAANDHTNPGNETNDELLADKSSLEAKQHLDEQRIAILERDNAELRKQNDDARAARAVWQDAFGLGDGVDPKDRVRETVAKNDALAKRVHELQVALGIGDGDDAQKAAATLRAPGKSYGAPSQVPPWGLLLMLTQLAKHDPYIGAGYRMTPDVLVAPNGDQWTVMRQEATSDETGEVGHVVAVQRTPSAFRYHESQSQKLKLDADLALALRTQKDAQKAADVRSLTPESRRFAEKHLAERNERVADLRAQIETLKPDLEPPKVTEWRVSSDLAAYDGTVSS